ncbi:MULTISPECIES: hypothetical protein [unclassified Sphingomonas]|uniref:hypothetical protein n=1 Tax=unclassified Sphingomonas TaxID=196159 RepID=UPI0021508A4E|nr:MULTISPECIES: hypothetical protein [unclassified Sphingomonas]MCR5869796.1 hypothetical protein [Sphingomonas sp. J344]UUX98501.1 hypothetical protein LRS08_13175 [Sphingomonas sp. J315]
MAEARIFISMGTPYTDEQRRFRDDLETFLRDTCGVNPRIIGKNEYPDGNPLTKIKSVMSQCHGVIVVAYERKFLETGKERRVGPTPSDLTQRAYTTPWNHIESAMAYTLGIPLYILCENGLTEEGLIESKLDWYVQRIAVRSDELARPDVRQSLQGWVANRVAPLSRRPRILRTIEGNVKLSDMTPKEMLGALAIIVAAFTTGATVATLVPQLFK